MVVAVKVQHRLVKRNSNVDIATMDALTRVIKRVFPDFKFMWLAEEMKKNLPLELDFVHEGHNADRARRMLSHFKFLKIVWKLSSDRVLVMEFCEGGQVNDIAYMRNHNISAPEVCKRLGQIYSEMIFVHGYVHCDPHPGNMLVFKHPQRGAEIVLLDHGLYTVLDENFRMQYANLWLGLLSRDLERIQYYSRCLGVGDLYRLFACMVTTRSWDSITTGIDKQPVTEDENMKIASEVGNYLKEITEILNGVSRPMLMILKTNDLLRNIERSLCVGGSAYSFTQMSLCCAAAVRDYNVHRADSCNRYFLSQLSYFGQILRIYIYELISSVSIYFHNVMPGLKKLPVS
ncbi:unnamed protein product [Soboliphyme baturini]|uniref:ABC1 domain-containing protein n=1 Tax=Soboliphyme baturini TaxID=241478 RepID=A0A183IBN2_9BILA|nr:unnamed protein product [Soboliphyme baturini]